MSISPYFHEHISQYKVVVKIYQPHRWRIVYWMDQYQLILILLLISRGFLCQLILCRVLWFIRIARSVSFWFRCSVRIICHYFDLIRYFRLSFQFILRFHWRSWIKLNERWPFRSDILFFLSGNLLWLYLCGIKSKESSDCWHYPAIHRWEVFWGSVKECKAPRDTWWALTA